MSQLKLSFDLDQLDPPVIEFILFELGAWSVSLESGGGDRVLEPAHGTAPLGQTTRLSALFAADADPDGIQNARARTLHRTQPVRCDVTLVDDHDREAIDRQHWQAMSYGRRLWI